MNPILEYLKSIRQSNPTYWRDLTGSPDGLAFMLQDIEASDEEIEEATNAIDAWKGGES